MSAGTEVSTTTASEGLRRAVGRVAFLNLSYFGVEFAVAIGISSVSLFADSVDFLEDAAVNVLIFVAILWSPIWRARVGMLLAGILLLPAIAFLWALWSKFNAPIAPAAIPLSITGMGALAINITCAFMLARYRAHGGSLSRAAFLSARNDAVANLAIIGAGIVTALHPTIWPDVVVGIGIALMNIGAAKEVWEAARTERNAES